MRAFWQRVVLAVVILCLVAVTTGFVVTARSESNRARRFQQSAARTNDRARSVRARVTALESKIRSTERLQQRLETDSEVLPTIDLAPMYSYQAVFDVLASLTVAASDLVLRNSFDNVHGALDPLLRDAQAKLRTFEHDLVVYAAHRDEFRSAVLAARGR